MIKNLHYSNIFDMIVAELRPQGFKAIETSMEFKTTTAYI